MTTAINATPINATAFKDGVITPGYGAVGLVVRNSAFLMEPSGRARARRRLTGTGRQPIARRPYQP